MVQPQGTLLYLLKEEVCRSIRWPGCAGTSFTNQDTSTTWYNYANITVTMSPMSWQEQDRVGAAASPSQAERVTCMWHLLSRTIQPLSRWSDMHGASHQLCMHAQA